MKQKWSTTSRKHPKSVQKQRIIHLKNKLDVTNNAIDVERINWIQNFEKQQKIKEIHVDVPIDYKRINSLVTKSINKV